MRQNQVKTEEVNSATLAQLLGLNVRTIQRLTGDGILTNISKTRSLRFNLQASLQAYVAYLKSGEKSQDQQDLEAKLKKQKLEAEIALKESQGELHEMKTRLFEGSIIEVDDVKQDYEAFFKVLKSVINAIPGRVAGILSDYADPVTVRKAEKDITDELNRTMETFVVRGNAPTKAGGRGGT